MSTYRRRFVPLFIGVLFSLCLINSQATAESQEARTNKFVHATPSAASSGGKDAEKEKVISQYGKLPAFFIENQGQTAKEVKYYFKGNDNVYFTDNGVMFQKIETQKRETGIEDSNVGAGLPRPHRDGDGDGEAIEAKALAYILEFVGARPTSPQARNELKGKVNYLIGNDRAKWHSNIPTYQEIVYPNLYPAHAEDSTDIKSVVFSSLVQSSSIEPNVSVQATSLNQQGGGIDLVYKGVPGGMKYEFIVNPGANPDDIRLAYTGIEGLSIDDTGNLIIHTSLGDVKDAKPYCYQEIDGKKVEVSASFRLNPPSPSPLINVEQPPQSPFDKGEQPPQSPLIKGGRGVVFPSLVQSSTIEPIVKHNPLSPPFLRGINWLPNVSVQTASLNQQEEDILIPHSEIHTSHFEYGFQVASYNKAYPLIIDPGLEYSTLLGGSPFLGGSGEDQGYSIAVDGLGNVYVTGFTFSGDFPTTAGAFDTSFNGGFGDAFVTKLNATGTALEYSTFLGGSDHEVGSGIAVDGSGNVYVTGYTFSSDFPTTPGAYDETHNGGSPFPADAFVTKLNTTGTALEYSTFLGGSGQDGGHDIAVDGSGYAYVTGYTYSSDFPTTTGAFDTSLGGIRDAFVTKLNATGTALEYSTFLGGSAFDHGGFGIAVDGSGNAYVTGYTLSSDFPTTAGAFDTSLNGSTDAFVSKLNATGTALDYSTFLGGSDWDGGFRSIAVDGSGNAYVAGWTNSSDFPTTPGAFDESYNGLLGLLDVFVTKLNATGTALDYSTFLGGSDWEAGHNIAVDGSGNAYVTGWTNSSDFPTTPDAFDTSLGGITDAFVTKLNATGTALDYSTFIGGSDIDVGFGIAVDGSGNAYVMGGTYSTDFPTTTGAFDTSFNGYVDTYVAKFSFNSPPEAEAGFIPIDVEEDEGHFEIVATATDPDDNLESIISVIALPSLDGLDIELNVEDEVKIEFNLEEGKVEVKGPDPEALLAEIEENGGLPVENGQYVWIEITDEAKYELKYEDGVLHIEAPEVTLSVTATDTEGLTDTATASPVFPPEDE